MRLFVALDIDPEIRRRIGQFRDQMRPYAPDVRWVSPDSFHITLKFIDETDKLPDIRAALQQVRGAAIPLSFRGTGFFPNARSPRVFWIGIESDERLATLATTISEVLRPFGLKQENIPYAPHLTLARSGSGRPHPVRGEKIAPALRVIGIKLEGVPPQDFGSTSAHEFFLYESKTSPSGAKYTKLHAYPLG